MASLCYVFMNKQKKYYGALHLSSCFSNIISTNIMQLCCIVFLRIHPSYSQGLT